jgi:hypothetical protein
MMLADLGFPELDDPFSYEVMIICTRYVYVMSMSTYVCFYASRFDEQSFLRGGCSL